MTVNMPFNAYFVDSHRGNLNAFMTIMVGLKSNRLIWYSKETRQQQCCLANKATRQQGKQGNSNVETNLATHPLIF